MLTASQLHSSLLFLLLTLATPHITPAHARDGSYNNLIKRMRSVCDLNTSICSLSTINSMYGLGSQGYCGDAVCEQHVMRIGCSSPSLPHVFVSGALHGDERLGPIVTVEFGALLMRQYQRSRWSTRIVDSRCIVLFPIANARGCAPPTSHKHTVFSYQVDVMSSYYMREREDNGVDPNRCAPLHHRNTTSNVIFAPPQHYQHRYEPHQGLCIRAPRLLQVSHSARGE
jgi:hypothetical protein